MSASDVLILWGTFSFRIAECIGGTVRIDIAFTTVSKVFGIHKKP